MTVLHMAVVLQLFDKGSTEHQLLQTAVRAAAAADCEAALGFFADCL